MKIKSLLYRDMKSVLHRVCTLPPQKLNMQIISAIHRVLFGSGSLNVKRETVLMFSVHVVIKFQGGNMSGRISRGPPSV